VQQDDRCALAVVEDCQPDLRLLSFFWAAAHGSCDYLSVGVFPAGRSRDAAGAQKKKKGRIPSNPFLAPLNAQVAELRTVCEHSALAYQGGDMGAVRDSRLAEFSMKRESLRLVVVGDRHMPSRYQDRPRTARLE
jgi:hypothetical protein